MSMIEKENRFNTIIDFIGLGSIGIICFCYSLFWSDFAEIHISLPFLDFPIFVGEILLLWCAILLAVKWRTMKFRLGRAYWLFLIYVAWVLFRALHGYFQWGPLALRNAALFYYPLFAVIGYHFYREGFFNQKFIGTLFVVFIAVKIIMGKSLIYYFLTPYLLLSIMLALKMKSGWLKYPALAILLFLFSYKSFFQGSRSFLIANLAVLLFLFVSYILGISKFRKTTKIVSLIVFFLALVFSFLKFAPQEKVQSLTTPHYLITRLKAYDEIIWKNKKDFVRREIPVQIYNPNKDQLKLDGRDEGERISREGKVRGRVPDIITEDIENKVDQGGIESDNVDEQSGRGMQTEYGNIFFRILIWRDMVKEVIKEKAWFGFSFGKPQRSISLENAGFAAGEWGRDGWIAPHNAFLHMIYRAGIIGFFVVLGIFVSLCLMIREVFRKRLPGEPLLVAILIYWLMLSSFLVVLELPYQAIPFWALFGMIFAHLYKDKEKLV